MRRHIKSVAQRHNDFADFERMAMKTAKVGGKLFGIWFLLYAVLGFSMTAAIVYLCYAGAHWLMTNS